MLPVSSGSNVKPTTLFGLSDLSQVGEVRRFATNLANQLDFDETRSGRLSILVNEIGNNLVKYGKDGRILLREISEDKNPGIEILAVDSGPGFDTYLAMQDGFTTGSTPGTGLGAIQRLSDEFDIFSNSTGTVLMSRVYADVKKSTTKYEMGSVNLPLKGESVCGDSWCAIEGATLEVFMVDGLGHGHQASVAADEAVNAFRKNHDQNVDVIIQSVHQRLKATRGGAVFVLRARENEIEFSGVGNIRALIQSAGSSKTLISQNGTAGLQIRSAKAMTQAWDGTGFLILHSDGLTSRWDLSAYPRLFTHHPALIAAVLLRDHCRGTDDATVLVIRRRFQS